MPLQVLICDDSSVARKQMARSLPADWQVELHYASDGLEGLEKIRQGQGEVVFLDLTMPNLDGYGVLEKIRHEDLPCMVIVVSGDIQPDAQDRVKKLGAMGFIKKPIDSNKTRTLLKDFGLFDEFHQSSTSELLSKEQQDYYQELLNVAVGRAASNLAKLLDAYVMMPIPKIRLLDYEKIKKRIMDCFIDNKYSAVCQSFIGSNIAGEAMVSFRNMNIQDLATLLNMRKNSHKNYESELLTDISSILIGSCLSGLGEQLGIHFNQSIPVVIDGGYPKENIMKYQGYPWENSLVIEIHYGLEKLDIDCELIFVITEHSLKKFNKKIHYMLD